MAATQAADPRIGTFRQVQGDAWVGTGTTQRAAQPGAGVGLAVRLSTGPLGAATRALKDGTALTMGPDTVMDLRQFQFDGTTQQGNFLLDPLCGSVRVVGVRGTDFAAKIQDAC